MTEQKISENPERIRTIIDLHFSAFGQNTMILKVLPLCPRKRKQNTGTKLSIEKPERCVKSVQNY